MRLLRCSLERGSDRTVVATDKTRARPQRSKNLKAKLQDQLTDSWIDGGIFAVILIVGVWILCGLLVRFTFVGAFSRAAEGTIAKYVLDYAKYKSVAEEKLEHKVKVLDYTRAMIRWQKYWRPADIGEQDKDANCELSCPTYRKRPGRRSC